MIKVEHLYKGFDGVQVLKDISVEYKPGMCNMIIGASGSGKTVLLKNLIGLMEPDQGQITYGASKATLEALTRSIALEVAKYGITVTNAPGTVN